MPRTETARGDTIAQQRKILGGVLLLLVALGLWLGRDLVSSWFATSYVATIDLTTFSETDDSRVQRAFAAAQSTRGSDATFELLPGLTHIRHSAVHVPGPSRAAALAAAQARLQAIVAAFDAEGPGRLDARVLYRADPAPNSTSDAVFAVLVCGALAAAVVGLVLFWRAWRGWSADAPGMPRSTVFIAIAVAGLPVLAVAMPGWLFMALFAMLIPSMIAGAIVYKMRDVQRAALWPSAQARIVRSRMRAIRRQKAGEATTVGNVPDIEYVFSVDGTEYRGHRISIGDIQAGSPQARAALERYKVGRTGPVFYNPGNPKEAVLERGAPARPAVMYGIACGVMLVGLAVVITFTRASDIIAWLQPYFPPGAVVQGVLFFAAAGLLTALFLVSSLRRSLGAARWPTTAGEILSSIAEQHQSLVSGGQGQTVSVWSPVVEYSYQIEGRAYHGSRIAFGADVAGPRDFAQSIANRYPAGSAVIVHFDPANPSFAVLEPRVAFAWPTLALTVAFFAAAWFFSR